MEARLRPGRVRPLAPPSFENPETDRLLYEGGDADDDLRLRVEAAKRALHEVRWVGAPTAPRC
jgi:hypothetical protein